MTLLGNFVRTSGQVRKVIERMEKDAHASCTFHRNGHEMEHGAPVFPPFLCIRSCIPFCFPIVRLVPKMYGHAIKISQQSHALVGSSMDEVREQVRGPFSNYLRSSVDLWLARSPGQDIGEFTEEELADLVFTPSTVTLRPVGSLAHRALALG